MFRASSFGIFDFIADSVQGKFICFYATEQYQQLSFCYNTVNRSIVYFPPCLTIIHTIVPQLSKCLKFEAVWGGGGVGGVLADQMI